MPECHPSTRRADRSRFPTSGRRDPVRCLVPTVLTPPSSLLVKGMSASILRDYIAAISGQHAKADNDAEQPQAGVPLHKEGLSDYPLSPPPEGSSRGLARGTGHPMLASLGRGRAVVAVGKDLSSLP